MRRCILVLSILLCSISAFPQGRFGITVRCGAQADFGSFANCGFTSGVACLGVLHADVLDISLGIGYSNKHCSHEKFLTVDTWQHGETVDMIHQMIFINVPFAVDVQCWQHGNFLLKIHNELEYNRLFINIEFLKGNRQSKTIEKWSHIPREATNGLTYRLGLNATYTISDYCILSLTPFFGVKAILNQYETTPIHFPSEQHSPLPDHRFSSGVIIGVEYRF